MSASTRFCICAGSDECTQSDRSVEAWCGERRGGQSLLFGAGEPGEGVGDPYGAIGNAVGLEDPAHEDRGTAPPDARLDEITPPPAWAQGWRTDGGANEVRSGMRTDR